jgi:hypothetical protein
MESDGDFLVIRYARRSPPLVYPTLSNIPSESDHDEPPETIQNPPLIETNDSFKIRNIVPSKVAITLGVVTAVLAIVINRMNVTGSGSKTLIPIRRYAPTGLQLKTPTYVIPFPVQSLAVYAAECSHIMPALMHPVSLSFPS